MHLSTDNLQKNPKTKGDQIMNLLSINNKFIVAPYVSDGIIKDTNTGGKAAFARIQQKVAIVGLKLLVNTLYDGLGIRLQAGQCFTSAEKCNTAAGDDTFFYSRAGGMQRIFDACFLFLHLGFGSSTDLDDGNAAGSLARRSCSFSRS